LKLFKFQLSKQDILIFQVERPITMKKDGIQTRNRKLAAKAKKKRMHDFFKPLDPRFSAYTGMHGTAGSYLTNPMSQYYAGQMGQMSSFMSNSMPSAMSMGSPMSHLTGKNLFIRSFLTFFALLKMII